jgi:DNA processing protein
MGKTTVLRIATNDPHAETGGLVSDRNYWLGFSLVPEIGNRRLAILLHTFGNLEHAWRASESDLIAAGLDRRPLQNLLQVRKTIHLQAELDKIERCGAWFVTQAEEGYPELLKPMPDAPPLLYVRGTLIPQDNRAIAAVGTRKASPYGRDVAYTLCTELGRAGVTVVSGLALGIDTSAHRGVLHGGGRTLAVLGSGIDRIYPPENHKLAEQIMQQGALISEFPIGTPPEGRNFPRRNRVISGLSLGVLVVEAPEKSGAILTANVASDQGREVFAVPGSILNPSNRGTNRLIQDGAKLVMETKDILEEFNLAHGLIQSRVTAERIAPANPTEEAILNQLSLDPTHIDDLARLSGLPIATLSSTLTILELKGLARTTGYMQYCLIPS